MKKYHNERWLRDQYKKDGKSTREIARKCNISHPTIIYWLNKFDVQRRYPNEPKKIDISDNSLEWIEGLILGDGSLRRESKNGGVKYRHTDSFEEYIEWLSSKFEQFDFGITSTREIKGKYKRFQFETNSVRDLIPLYEQWYSNDKKEIPTDFKISPIKILFWYLGDGSLVTKGNGDHIIISSYSMRRGLENITDQLEENNITSSVNKKGIRIWKDSIKNFLKYIKGTNIEVPGCYQYKLHYGEW